MAKLIFIIFIFLLIACAKKEVALSGTLSSLKTPVVKFVFINHIGFRNDSTRHGGVNDTVLIGVCLDLKYYDKKANISHLDGTCYNRNFPADNFPLTDSIFFKEYEASKGCKYLYEIEFVWKQTSNFSSTKNIKYNLKEYPGADTLKFARDTIIKFVWPNDTASGRFVKTYQWP